MTVPISLWLVTNHASGSNDDAALAALAEAFAAAGIAPARRIDFAQGDGADLSAALLHRAGATHLVIYAGDGTVSAVLSQVEGWSGAVLVLPGGTMNLLAKALHGPDVAAAPLLAALGRGELRPSRSAVIGWSGGKAVCEVLAGPGACWSDVREELREGNVIGVAQTAIGAASKSTDGTALVRIVDPPLGKPGGYSGVRLVPSEGGIVVQGYGVEGLGDYLRQGIALLRRDFRDGPRDELGQVPSLVCRSVDGSPIDLMIDGERAQGSASERFERVPLAVNLLVAA